MAGGIGSRLWPLSRVERPKQFMEVANTGKSFLQHTYERFCTIVPPENIIVVTAARYGELVKEQLPSIPAENVLLEPYQRNTAPCIIYATCVILKRNPAATIVVTPSDHIIEDVAPFRANVVSALEFASHNDVLVTLGITPTRPDPNYGYIQAKGGKDAAKDGEALKVKTFTEKPPVEIARVFIQSGEFLWNSGIFAWKASVIAEEIQKYMPELAGWFEGWENSIGTPDEAAFIEKAYAGCERIPVDIGVMEKTSRAWVYPATFGWWDIGSWDSLYTFIDKDRSGNGIDASHSTIQDTRNTLMIEKSGDKMVCLSGLDGYMVIDTPDVLVVCPRGDSNLRELSAFLGLPENKQFR